MSSLIQHYREYAGYWNLAIASLVFAGVARIAFWRERDGTRMAGPLILGLGLLLALGLAIWAEEHGRDIDACGPWALFLLIQAVLLTGFNFWRKTRNM